MLRIAICDEDYIFIRKIEEYIGEIEEENLNMDFKVISFSSSVEFLEAINSGEIFDIIFIDIEMEKVTGIEIGKVIRTKFDTVLVYIANTFQYFVELFSIKPFGFLRKPLKFSDFKHIFFVIYKHIFDTNVFYEFTSKRLSLRIKFRDIIYFKSNRRQITIYTINGNYDFNGKLSDVYSVAKNFDFMMIHKSYVVNYNHIMKISYDYVVMNNGDKIDISERKKKEIRKLYMQICEKNHFKVMD